MIARGLLSRERSLLVLLVLFFTVIHGLSIARITHAGTGTRSAFLRWRTQLQELDEGVNVWEKYAYPNPPIMALILQPFFQMPPLVGSTMWFLAKALMTLVAVFVILGQLDAPNQTFPFWGKALAVVLSLRPVEGDLVHGNVNLFILFLLVMALAAFCKRRDSLAGLWLGLSIACKLTPALFVAYFLWKRAWKTLLATGFSLLVFVFVIPALAYGWNNNLNYLRSWHEQMIAPFAQGIVTSEHKNQSLPGLLTRMLADEPSFSSYDGMQKVVRDTHNVVSLSRESVQVILVACMGIFVLLAAWHCRPRDECRPSWRVLAECSVVILGMLLFCERTWKHHCVTLLIPFSVAAYVLSAPTTSRALRWYLGLSLAAAALLMLSTSSGHLDAQIEPQARWGKAAEVYGAYVWVFLILLASTLVILSRHRDNELDGK
jgi:hypothetical protein